MSAFINYMAELFSKTTPNAISQEVPDIVSRTSRADGDSVNLLDTLKQQIEPPLSIADKNNPVPYTAQFFKIENYSELNDYNDIDLVREQVNVVDKYIKDAILSSGLKDSKASYNEIMSKISEILGLSENEIESEKLYKIYSIININKKLNSLFRNNILDKIVKKK